jgi:hypothetical protein
VPGADLIRVVLSATLTEKSEATPAETVEISGERISERL